MENKSCPFEQFGLKPKKVYYITVKDKNGIIKDKFLKVVEGSILYKKLFDIDGKQLISHIIE